MVLRGVKLYLAGTADFVDSVDRLGASEIGEVADASVADALAAYDLVSVGSY